MVAERPVGHLLDTAVVEPVDLLLATVVVEPVGTLVMVEMTGALDIFLVIPAHVMEVVKQDQEVEVAEVEQV